MTTIPSLSQYSLHCTSQNLPPFERPVSQEQVNSTLALQWLPHRRHSRNVSGVNKPILLGLFSYLSCIPQPSRISTNLQTGIQDPL